MIEVFHIPVENFIYLLGLNFIALALIKLLDNLSVLIVEHTALYWRMLEQNTLATILINSILLILELAYIGVIVFNVIAIYKLLQLD